MNKKVIAILMLLICFFSLNNVNAESVSNFMDINAYENIYKLSEDSEVSLPFIKVFSDRAYFDKNISNSGLSIGQKTIEVNEKISGVQMILATDTVDIKGALEYGIIVASNVVISGNIEKDVLIVSESLFITDTANIGGDIVAVAETIEMKGNASGSFIGSSSNLLMQGNVGKDFRVNSETLEFTEANVGGNIYIETNSDLDISKNYPNAIVKKIDINTINKEQQKTNIINTIVKTIVGVIMFTLLNLLIVKIKPNMFKNLSDKFLQHSSYGIIAGTLGLVTIPIVITILIVLSLFGIGVVAMPILVVYIALIVVIISLAKFIIGSVIYEIVKDKLKINSKLKSIGILLLIYAALYLLGYIPHIGYFVTMTTVLLSSGIVFTGLTKKVTNSKK